jgi:hypothetical protein
MRDNLQFAIAMAFLAGLAAGAALDAIRDYAPDNVAADRVWSTKKVMNKVHSGKQSLFSLVYTDIHKPEPDWKTDEKNLAEIIRLMSMLTKQKPLRGSQEAWDRLVQDYLDKVKLTQLHVKEHKLQAARSSLAGISSTCDECHDNHGIK